MPPSTTRDGKAFGVSCYDTSARGSCAAICRRPGRGVQGRVSRPLRALGAQADELVFHSVGASDRLEASDPGARIHDGLPGTLEEWIARDGLSLQDEAQWRRHDRRRRARRAHRSRRDARAGIQRWHDWKYPRLQRGLPECRVLIEVLQRMREATPRGFERILYIEQPTNRDLKKDRANVMHAAARLRPVVADESLTDLETLLLAREMGYTGVALESLQGQPPRAYGGGGAEFGLFLPCRT